MGKLTVTFDGICTWVPAYALGDLNPPIAVDSLRWRVVLPSGGNGFSYTGLQSNGPQSVPPHMAALDISGANISSMTGALPGVLQLTPVSWALRGVTMMVPNAVPTPGQPPQTPIQTPECTIPSLTACAHLLDGQKNLALDGGAVAGQRSAAFFDIYSGTLTPSYLNGSANQVAHVVYEVETYGLPKLRVSTNFNQTSTTIDFADENVFITVENVGQGADTFWDFVIHYLACTSIPTNLLPPGPNPPPDDGLTSGCSNSQFP